jgi:hypothetical protein
MKSILWLFALAAASLVGPAKAATVSWVGVSGDWNTAANWSAGAVPGPEDEVLVDVPGTITITHSSGAHSVRSILCQEAFTLSGGALVGTTNLQGTNGQSVIATSADGWLSGVTLNGNIDLAAQDALIRLARVVTLNGRVTLSGPNERP